MLEWVVLGVDGVLEPRALLWRAEAEAAGGWLRERDLDVPGIDALVYEALERAEPAPIRAALVQLGLRLEPARERQLVLHVRQAVPHHRCDPALRAMLQALRARCPLAYLDRGPGPRMQAWLDGLGVTDLAQRRLWISDLGRQAQPPRRLAFRWLAQRLESRPEHCLYVAGSAPMAAAASASGFRVLIAPDAGAAPVGRGGEATTSAPLASVLDAIEQLATELEAAV